MNKEHFELVDRLFVDTSADQFTWIKADKPDVGFTSQYVKWKTESRITDNKFLLFTLQHHVDDYRFYELKVFLVNKSEKTKVLVMELEQPGLFDFKIKRRVEDLIYLLLKKNRERFQNMMGPFPQKRTGTFEDNPNDWNEVVY